MSEVHKEATYSNEVYEVPLSFFAKEGKKPSLCTCGLSRVMPFCDGSHAGTGFKSMPLTIKGDKVLIKSKQQLKRNNDKLKQEQKLQKAKEEQASLVANTQTTHVFLFAILSVVAIAISSNK